MSDSRTDEIARVEPAAPPAINVTPTPRPQPVVVALHHSDTIDELIGALCDAQAEYAVVKKDRTANIKTQSGAQFSYSYATLAAVLEATRPVLNRHGIVIVQSPMVTGTDRGTVVRLDTRFVHKSGQWIGSVLSLPLHNTDPQGLGSLLTYLRRYALSALAGVASEDDDDGHQAQGDRPSPGASRSKPAPSRQATKPAPREVDPRTGEVDDDVAAALGGSELPPPGETKPRTTKPQPTKPAATKPQPTKPAAAAPAPVNPAVPDGITKAERSQLFKVATDCGWSEQDVKSLIHQLYQYASTSQLTRPQLSKVISCIEHPTDNGVSFEDVDGKQVLVVKAHG